LTACGNPAATNSPAATGSDADTAPDVDAADSADVDATKADADAQPDVPDAADAADGSTDAADSGDSTAETADAGDDAVVCCPMGSPSCDCTAIGGSPSKAGGCTNNVCDAAPLGWKQAVDANGCPYWLPGPQSCMMPQTACDKDPPVFPGFTKECSTDADCGWGLQQIDCCGTKVAIGVWAPVLGVFKGEEQICEAQFPKCNCPAQPSKADDGKTSAPDGFAVKCVANQCSTYVP
jgi:hypothetical protein